MLAARRADVTASVRSVSIFWRFKVTHSSTGAPAASLRTTLKGLSHR